METQAGMIRTAMGITPDGIMCIYPDRELSRTAAGDWSDDFDDFEYHGPLSWTQARQYGAEESMAKDLPEHRIGSVEEAQKLANQITDKAGVPRAEVSHDPRYHYSFAQAHHEHPGRGRIVLSTGGMNRLTLLHEVAHHIDRHKGTQDPDEVHGDSFRQHFEDLLPHHHPNSYVAQNAFRHHFYWTDQKMRDGVDARHGERNPEMTEKERAAPPVEKPHPLWESDPEHVEKANNAMKWRSEPHGYLKYMHQYPELDYEDEGDYERADAHMADEDLAQGLSPHLVPPHMLEAWVKHHPNPKAMEEPEWDEEGNDKPLHHTGAAAEESQHFPRPVGFPDESSYTHEEGVHRGVAVVLPPHIHKFVHDPDQPPAAKAHMLLSEIKKQKAQNNGPEGETGSTGGLGNYWSPSPHKAAEYATGSGYEAYRQHERQHNCGDPDYGDGGCPTTEVVMHADTPGEKHHWHEQHRPGEKYDPSYSWRLLVRPGSPVNVRGVSWREGNDHWDSSRKYSDEGSRWHKETPFTRYDFAHPVKKQAGVTFGPGAQMGESEYDPDETWDHRPMWDQWHPKLNPEVHRHLALDLPGSHPAHNEKLPMEERARSVLAETVKRGNVGTHWTDDPDYDHLSTGNGRVQPGQTRVTLHAKTPPRDHIEDADWVLEQRGVRDWDFDPEREVPMKRNAPLEVHGITWHSVKGPVRHDFGQPIRVHAGFQVVADYESPQTQGHYDAEHKALDYVMDERRYNSAAEAQQHADEITDKEGLPRVHVTIRRTGGDSRYLIPNPDAKTPRGRMPKVQLHHEMLDEHTLIHELAHHKHITEMFPGYEPNDEAIAEYQDDDPGGHGGGFQKHYHQMITDHHSKGRDFADDVRYHAQKRGVWKAASVSVHTPDSPLVISCTPGLRSRSASVPAGTKGVDNEGHRVQMTDFDGWAHMDGSHGHEDNTNIGDHPVRTEHGIWTPSGRYWGPNSEENDQRLFDGEHLRPEVREDILDRLNHFFDDHGYVGWREWAKVYFAGSEAAKWAPFNGDFDIIIGINWPDFREANPQHEDENDLQVATEMTDGLWKHVNVDSYYFHLDDGKTVGPFDRTFFVNPLAWDIRKLHPYAAYDVTDDRWAVKPLMVPKDWSAASLPDSYWEYADSLVKEIDAIGKLPPEERARMADNLWEQIHTHRSDAFSDGGKGMFDISNIIEKYLDQHPEKPWARLKKWRSAPARPTASEPEPFIPTTASSVRNVQEADGADYDGVMVALVPPAEVCHGLAVDGGEPVDNMHITLAYLGGKEEHDEDQLAMLPHYVQAWARTQKPLKARVGGVGTFVNPAEHVLWAAVDIPHGTVFRDSLVDFLERRGYQVRHDHGWTPHITLQYSNSHFRFMPKIHPQDWDVTDVFCCIGGTWRSYPLGG